MIFWIITIALSALVVLMLARPVIRGPGSSQGDAADYDLRVYRDQLAEVERDVARGVIAAEDGERAITEISRRILTADAARDAEVSRAPVKATLVIAVLGVALVGGGVGLYAWIGQPGYGDLALEDRIAFAEELRENRPDQQTAVDSLPPFVPPAELSDEFKTLLDRLRETVAGRPDDVQGHRLLAQNEARIGNFVDAARAQQTVLRLLLEEASAADIADYGELLVMAAGGYVSPEAEAAFRGALGVDEADPRSRYYIGLMMVQTGRPDIAFRLWDALLRRGPPDAPWIDPILAQIEAVAELAGVNYDVPAVGAGAARGPSAADVDAAADMTPEERMEMIGAMVEGLSDRLATEGGPPADWARLITSLGVMGNRDQAFAVFQNAMEVFADDPGAIDTIRAAGQQAGVAE